jgi:hypothetical protein
LDLGELIISFAPAHTNVTTFYRLLAVLFY